MTGYWAAWSCAIIASSIGILLQALMLQQNNDGGADDKHVETPQDAEESANEETPLLLSVAKSVGKWETRLRSLEAIGVQVYMLLLTNNRFIGGLICGSGYAIVSASFGTTLPLHVHDIFHWGSFPTGVLFAAIQGPNMIFSVPVRWLKDRIGTKHVTAVSFTVLAPLLWLAGIPGDKRFPWANATSRGPVLYGAAIAGIGMMSPFVNGVGMMEATRMQTSFFHDMLT